MGNSFSALAIGFLPLLVFFKFRFNGLIFLFITTLGLFIFIILANGVFDGSIRVYDKSIEHFITGSGRFSV